PIYRRVPPAQGLAAAAAAAAAFLRIDPRIPFRVIPEHPVAGIEDHVQQLDDAVVLVPIAPGASAVRIDLPVRAHPDDGADLGLGHAGLQLADVLGREQVAHLAHALVRPERDAVSIVAVRQAGGA